VRAVGRRTLLFGEDVAKREKKRTLYGREDKYNAASRNHVRIWWDDLLAISPPVAQT
jgi:hypothetical protein